VICEECFSNCRSLKAISFESESKLSRIEGWAFFGSGLTSIHFPASVEVICESCFSNCTSLASISFESGSKLCESRFSAAFRARFPDAFSRGLKGASSAISAAIAIAGAGGISIDTEVYQDYEDEKTVEYFWEDWSD
jgi:hypothetical protein